MKAVRGPSSAAQWRYRELIDDLDKILSEVVAEAQAIEYRAFGQSLREMALLEATMQTVAEAGRRVLQRLAQGRDGQRAG